MVQIARFEDHDPAKLLVGFGNWRTSRLDSLLNPSSANEVAQQPGMPSRVEHGDNHGAIRLDEIINRQIALRHECPALVVKLERKDLGIFLNPIRRRKIAREKAFAGIRRPGLKIIVSPLNVRPHRLQRDDRLTLHDRRLMDRCNSVIVTVLISPRAYAVRRERTSDL